MAVQPLPQAAANRVLLEALLHPFVPITRRHRGRMSVRIAHVHRRTIRMDRSDLHARDAGAAMGSYIRILICYPSSAAHDVAAEERDAMILHKRLFTTSSLA